MTGGGVNDGFVDEAWSRGRAREYLELATQTLTVMSPTNVIAHFARAEQDPAYRFDATVVPVAAWQPMFDDFTTLRDTTDFDMLYVLNLWAGYREALTPALHAAIEQAMHSFKYWYTEPTAPGVTDNRWYWSENHRIIYHTIEYLIGGAFPEDTFTNDGRTGAEHRDHAEALLGAWLDEKVRFGWSEWHSNVYYQKDATPLLTLVEHAPDRGIAQRAAMVLDLLLFDVASHLEQGTFGATHGRSYMKNKSTATDEDTFGLAKLLFDDTDLPYPSRDDAGAVLFARAKRYRVPEVIRRVATSTQTSVDEERMGAPLDPLAPIVPNPKAPYGYDFDDPANVPFWWERGAQATWQGVALTMQTLERHDLWDSEFFAPFKPLAEAVQGDPAHARELARSLAPMLGFGLLSEVNSYTWRTPGAMLSSAQDHRFGMFSGQAHGWQATLGPAAIVFTTHPKHDPQVGTEWPDDDGYFTGTGSMPASAQHGRAAIHVYDPAFAAPGATGPLATFDHLDETHAYFPQDHFDEVVIDGHWVFGRGGDGYVGLWSQRVPEWRAAPKGTFTHGMTKPFDLVAPGGARNVWVVEVGTLALDGSFAAFCGALARARVDVAGGGGDPVLHRVRFASPAQGVMELTAQHGRPSRLTVDGEPVALGGYPRFANPWVRADFAARRYTIRDGEASLVLDFDTLERAATS